MKSLAKQSKLKIKYDNQPKVGRPKNNLAGDEVEWLRVFFERPDITYTLLGMKDQKYTGKVNGESTFVQRPYLLWTLGKIVDILNGLPSTGTVGSFFQNSLSVFGNTMISLKIIQSFYSTEISHTRTDRAKFARMLYIFRKPSLKTAKTSRQTHTMWLRSFRVIQASENVFTQMNAMFATCVLALKTSNASINVICTAGKKLMEKYGKHV